MEKWLAIKLRRLGDTVLWTSALQSIARDYPSIRLDVVAPRALRDLLVEEPYLNRVFGVSAHVADRLAVASWLRWAGYSRVLVFHASSSSTFFGTLIGGSRSFAHSHEIGRTDFSVKPATERDRDTLLLAGLKSNFPLPEPKVSLRPEEIREAETWIRSKGLRQPLLGVGLGASRATKQWSFTRMAEVIREWSKRTGGSAIVICNAREARDAKAFWPLIQGVPYLPLVDAPLRPLAARLSLLRAFVGNDSGPRHLAAAVGVRTVTLFGPEDPHEWHPYDRATHPLCYVPDLQCRKSAAEGLPPWCGLETCKAEKHRCMEGISAREVWEKVERVLEGPSA